MRERVIISGAGGQGIMLAGKILALAAMDEGRFVTWFPSYGAEVRGGTAHCMVVISDVEIGFPYVDKADSVIAMNGLSAAKFYPRRTATGLFFVNSSLCDIDAGWRNAQAYPFTDTAISLGDVRVANMVALGSYVVRTNIVDLATVDRVIAQIAPADKKHLVTVNQRALAQGAALIQKKG